MLHIDYETYSEVDITKVGAYRYATDPSTEILMLAYAETGKAPKLWQPHKEEMPLDLKLSLANPSVILSAFNANFEYLITKFVLRMDIPVERYRCTMVKAYALGFTGSLEEIQQQIGVRQDKRKLSTGKKLIHRFCKPQPKSHKVRRWNWQNDPEQWQKFCEYCLQDVVAETELDLWLDSYAPMSDTEWDLWHLDQKINETGVPIDEAYAKGALELQKEAKQKIKEILQEKTGLSNPLSNSQMRQWLAEHGIFMPDLRADTLAQVDVGEYAPILSLYSRGVSTAATKYKKFIECSVDSGAHGMFQFAGASRTRRWAGRLVQLQNLKRGNLEPSAVEAIRQQRLDLLSLQGEPMDLLAQGVRSTIAVPEGSDYCLNVSDLSSIESRVLGWISGCRRILALFEEGKDTYKDFATLLFGIPYDEVTKEQRTFSKPPVLGCGYFLGWRGLIAYAESMGVTMSEEEAESAVYTFRDGYPEVVWFWDFIICSVEKLLVHGQETHTRLLHFTLSKNKQFLFITLPSGRRLAYYMPLWIEWDTPVGRRPSFTYMGVDRFTMKWERIAAHKGLITENIVQAIARDILAVWMLRADRAHFDIVLHVHDEIGCLETSDRIEELNSLIKQPIPWAPGLPLDSEGYVAKRYRK